MKRTLLVSGLLLSMGSGLAQAATFCVRNEAELVSALSAAIDNGQADEIRIARGTYYATTSARFRIDMHEPHGLTIRGGYTSVYGFNGTECINPSADASRTVLDGSNSVPVLTIRSLSENVIVPIVVEGLTLRNGLHNGQSWSYASALSVTDRADARPSIAVDRVIAYGNTATNQHVPTIHLTSDEHFVSFSNSIVRHNTTGDASQVHILSNAGGSALHGLTVIHNTRSGYGCAIEWFGSAPGKLASSLVWGNTGGCGDLGAQGNVQFVGNRYGTLSGAPPFPSDFNLSIADPMLQSPTLPRPTASSPLRNAFFMGTGVEDHDVYGQARTLGGRVDVGAAEYIE